MPEYDEHEDDRFFWEEHADSAVERLLAGAEFDEIRGVVSLPPHNDDGMDFGADCSNLEELEDHLRGQMDDLTHSGLSEDEAFLVAVKRMGRADDLSREFAVEHSGRLWKQLVLADSGPESIGGGNLTRALACAIAGAVSLVSLVHLVPADRIALNGPVVVMLFVAGYFAWQRDGVGNGQESITLIAYDAAGMSEAVGSFYEAVAGIDPLTRWSLATSSTITPASTQKPTPALNVTQLATLPDRVVGLKQQGAELTALSYDGTQVALGTCTAADCALTVLASVVSRRPDHAVVDAGALALSKDPGPLHLGDRWRWGMGTLFEDGEAYRAGRPSEVHLASLSQEHGVVSAPLPVGARVRVLPNHSCLAVPCFDACWVVRGEEVVGRWRIRRERV